MKLQLQSPPSYFYATWSSNRFLLLPNSLLALLALCIQDSLQGLHIPLVLGLVVPPQVPGSVGAPPDIHAAGHLGAGVGEVEDLPVPHLLPLGGGGSPELLEELRAQVGEGVSEAT